MSVAKRNFLSELEAIDWDFTGERASNGSGASHWYPARFVPQVPGILIGFLSDPAEVILDPFCGSGTSLVQSLRLGRSAVGIDTNPVAVLISRARTSAIPLPELRSQVGALRDRVSSFLITPAGGLDVPNYDENKLWYHEDTLHELAAIWNSIDARGPFSVVAQAVFSGVLKHACSQDKHWGWICDNVKPKELRYKPVVGLYFQRLDLHVHELGQLQQSHVMSEHEIIQCNTFKGASNQVLSGFPENSVDAVVTSPPYFGMTDYVRSQRLTYLWFDWSLDEDRALETGARYKRHRKSAHGDFLEELKNSFREVGRVLRPNGVLGLVAGESPDRAPYLRDLELLLTRECGLEVEAVLHRSVARQRALSSRDQKEEILIARRY